jgi:hypothetical protein
MSETESGRIRAVCPNCGKRYALDPQFVGRLVKCKQCQEGFTVKAADEAAVHAGAAGHGVRGGTAAAGGGTAAAVLCPVCQSAVNSGEPTTACPQCHSPHHQDCWDYNKGCGLYGCKEAPPTEKLQEIEIPASFWGQTEKQCPKCQKTIQAAALRCRFCGTEFKTTRPSEGAEFRREEAIKQSLPMHRTIGIIVLIAAIIPCTAPFAAIGGGIWYLVSRKAIARLPMLQATVARIGVGLAVIVTALLVVILLAYSAFNK